MKNSKTVTIYYNNDVYKWWYSVCDIESTNCDELYNSEWLGSFDKLNEAYEFCKSRNYTVAHVVHKR
jgi:hypothetical protein